MRVRSGTKSFERVKELGEVFTPSSTVNSMLDVLDEQLHKETTELEYIKKTYLEPACGDGQFLIAILERKLNAVNKLPLELRQYGYIAALCSIYGIDIQNDNVLESRERMCDVAAGNEVFTYDIDDKATSIQFVPNGFRITDDMLKTFLYIINNNIICGDTLSKDNTDIMMFRYELNDKDKTISIFMDSLNSEDSNGLVDKPKEIVGENIPFDKLYTLKSLDYFINKANNKNLEQAVCDDDFDF